MTTTPVRLAAVALLPVALLLAGCGGGDAASTSTAATSAAAPGEGGPGGANSEQFQAIRDCLSAAGIELPTMGARPSGAPDGERPTDRPTDLPQGTPPSGAPGGGTGPGGGMFQSEEAQAALKACGLEVPAGGPRPTATPTS